VPEPIAVPDLTTAQLLSTINAERSKANLPALLPDARLAAVAASWANMLHATNTLTHGTGSNSYDARLANAGFPGSGEIVAMGQTLPQVMTMWMTSPGHHDLILNPQFTRAGGGQSNDRWVVDFAK
jgi:uncharacterized protein YkwD